MSLEQKAKELAEEIKATDEYQEFSSAQARISLDPKAQDIVNQIQEERQKIETAQKNGEQITQEMAQKMQTLQSQAEENSTLKKLFDAQEQFNKIMQSVNDTLTNELY